MKHGVLVRRNYQWIKQKKLPCTTPVLIHFQRTN